MAARKNKIRHDENTKAKIRASQLVNRLQAYIFGDVKLEPSQVTAALGLLRKTIPDLSSVQSKVDLRRVDPATIADAELAAVIASDGSEDTATAPVHPSQLN